MVVESFGVQTVCIRLILFELCTREKKKKKKKKNKIETFAFDFLDCEEK